MADKIWNDPGFEPKRQYRWLLYLGSQATNIPTYVCTVSYTHLTLPTTPYE